MITDNALLVSVNQEVGATAVSTDSIDLRAARAANADIDIGIGERVRGFVICTGNGTPGAGTLNIQVITATDAALTTSIESLGNSQDMGDENYVAGMPTIFIEINMDQADLFGMTQRYLGLRYVAGVAMPANYTFTGGFIIGGSDTFRRSYPGGFEVF